MLDVTVAAAAAVDDAAPAAAALQLSSVGFVSCELGISSFFAAVVSQAGDSVVGTESSVESVARAPFVDATAPPRPLAPPRPRSVPLPRPPRPASKPPRTPRDGLVFVASIREADSFAFERDLSFLVFETSPHCVIVPE
jgi:hypothetical protein